MNSHSADDASMEQQRSEALDELRGVQAELEDEQHELMWARAERRVLARGRAPRNTSPFLWLALVSLGALSLILAARLLG